MAEQAQVLRACQHRRDAADGGLVAGDEAAAVLKRRAVLRGAAHVVGGAGNQLGQIELAAQVGGAAEDEGAAALVEQLNLDIGQVDGAGLRRAGGSRLEARGIGGEEAQPGCRAHHVDDGRRAAHDRRTRRRDRFELVGVDGVLLFDPAALAVADRDVGEVDAESRRHRPGRGAGVAVVDAAAGDTPLVLQRVAVGVGRFDAEESLVDAALAAVSGRAAAARGQRRDRDEAGGQRQRALAPRRSSPQHPSTLLANNRLARPGRSPGFVSSAGRSGCVSRNTCGTAKSGRRGIVC